ncbi:MAG: hypothetical protein GX162_01160 [Firmicutes bacterium]|nr:hypothetical protein [Bacillota bacterium]
MQDKGRWSLKDKKALPSLIEGVFGVLPTVDFCGLKVTRLIIGANPFGGYSHQSKERDQEMRAFHTLDRILETWEKAAAAGINTMITNNESPNVMEAVRRYMSDQGPLQWIAQVNMRHKPSWKEAIDEVVELGCKALYFHGGLVDRAFAEKEADELSAWSAYARSLGIPVGVAAHAPQAHLWVNSLDIVDFHAVCFFNCGSLHAGKGHRFRLADVPLAVDCIQRIAKPCIAYKIMGAGRIDPRMAFEYAFEHIKPGDVVNVGMHRGDKEDIVEENAALVREILEAQGS